MTPDELVDLYNARTQERRLDPEDYMREWDRRTVEEDLRRMNVQRAE